MRFVKWIAFCIFVSAGFQALCMEQSPQQVASHCQSFAAEARKYPNNFYVASIFVGSGECHVARQGDISVLIDAGARYPGVTDSKIVSFIKALTSGIQLAAVYCTHEHEDHSLLLRSLIDDKSIAGNRIFFGGIKENYFIVREGFTYTAINAGKHKHKNFSVNCRRIEGRPRCLDVNGHGSIIELNFAARKIAFLGDINSHTLSALETNGCLKSGTKVGEILECLKSADILTTPHHASLNNGEKNIYDFLGRNNKKRVFISSAAPFDTGAQNPRIKNNILNAISDATDNGVFDHDITYDIVPFTCQINEKIKIPLFSTYDASDGFVWTQITDTGIVSIRNKHNVFCQVLPPIQ